MQGYHIPVDVDGVVEYDEAYYADEVWIKKPATHLQIGLYYKRKQI